MTSPPTPHPPSSLERGSEGWGLKEEAGIYISTAAPAQLFPDSHENLILWGKSWGLVKARGVGVDFFLAPAQVLLPEALGASCSRCLTPLPRPSEHFCCTSEF